MEIRSSVRFQVDGREIFAMEGETYLQALQRAEIFVPTLCYDKELIPSGSCRLCIIEIEGNSKLLSACTTQVQDGKNVFVNSERISQARETIIELILADHPLICTVCDKQGNCTLQSLAYEYVSADKLKKYANPEDVIDPRKEENEFFILDYSMCIKCGKCVQVVDEIQHCGVLTMENRGVHSYPTAGFGRTFEEAGCVACGNCVSVCPVAALIPNTLIKGGREVDSQRVQTTCNYCGVGCQLDLVVHKRDNRIIYVDSNKNNVVNGQALCVKGKFGWDYIHSTERIDTPYIRKDGMLQPASWDEAYDLIEQKLGTIANDYGGDALAFLSSAKCTNEENYLMQKLARVGFQTNNIDHCARLCHASTVTGLAATFGSGAMTNSIDDLTNDAKVIFIIGSNTTEAHPVIGIKMKQAIAAGKTKLIVADPRYIELADYADIHIQQKPGTDLAIINIMLHTILTEDLLDHSFVAERTENFEELQKIILEQDPQMLANIVGVSLEKIQEAARMYAESDASAIVYAMGITQHYTGTYNVAGLANLAMLTGNVGRPGTGVNPLRGQNNVQGACDLGALPNVFPGYQKVDDPAIHTKFSEVWDTELSSTPGLTITEMMSEAIEGNVKGMYIMGENPALSDPNVNKVLKALKSLDFLVVQDLFISETAKYADVVLPAQSFAEKTGTFTNTERRVQMVYQALRQIGSRKSDWEILNELLIRFGVPTVYSKPSEIFDEIASVTPIYAGINHARIQNEGLQWPCTDENHSGTKILHTDTFARGKGKFWATHFIQPDELPDTEYPFILTTGRSLYHFHTGEMTHRSKGLHIRESFEKTEISLQDAERMNIVDGDRLQVRSRRGTVTTVAKVTEKILPGVVFMKFHDPETVTNLLTNDTLDPFAKIPELKVAAINIEKVRIE